jgi:hypothetical protein
MTIRTGLPESANNSLNVSREIMLNRRVSQPVSENYSQDPLQEDDAGISQSLVSINDE